MDGHRGVLQWKLNGKPWTTAVVEYGGLKSGMSSRMWGYACTELGFDGLDIYISTVCLT